MEAMLDFIPYIRTKKYVQESGLVESLLDFAMREAENNGLN